MALIPPLPPVPAKTNARLFIHEVEPAEHRMINELVARNVLLAFEPEFDVVYQTWLGNHSLRRNGPQQELPC